MPSLSKCCGAEVTVSTGSEGTSCYICDSCKEACDLKPMQENPNLGKSMQTEKLFLSPDGKMAVHLSNEVLEKILSLISEVGAKETGGILIGKISEDSKTAFVTKVEQATDSEYGYTNFYRGTGGLKILLDDLFKKGEFYLGEWHSHPKNSPEPSQLDKETIVSISQDENAQCPEAILLIVGENPEGQHHFSLSISSRKNGFVELVESPYEVKTDDGTPNVSYASFLPQNQTFGMDWRLQPKYFDPIAFAEWVKEERNKILEKGQGKCSFFEQGQVVTFIDILSYLASHGVTPKE